VQKSPFPHSGFPELLKLREGPVLHIATDGIWWTADAGTTWKKLDLPGSPYYPEALQLDDGTILVVGHKGGDNVYGSADQLIIQQTFRLNAGNRHTDSALLHSFLPGAPRQLCRVRSVAERTD
jgi:hypothetical protein